MSCTSAYLISNLKNLRVRLDINRVIDENSVLKNQSTVNSTKEIYFVFELISHNERYSPQKYSKFYSYPQKLECNEAILFDWTYENLSSDSRIAITIWSSAKKRDTNHPLGSTVISIFDENDCMRQGKYHLLIWPDTLPDHEWPTTTPGLVNDPNIQTLNFVADRKESMSKRDRNIHDNHTLEALIIKLHNTYRLIPAAFLEVQFPKFPYRVLYQDKHSDDDEQSRSKSQFSVSQTDFIDYFQVNDPDYQRNRNDPLEQIFYFLKRENEGNPEKMLPNKDDLKIIDEIVGRSFRIDDNFKSKEKQEFVKFRYYLSKDKRYLIHYLNSVEGTHEEADALKLIQTWDKIDWTDALQLLSKQFAVNDFYNKNKSQSHTLMKGVRDYATQIISGVSEDIFKSILLQLIQSVKYDMKGNSAMSRLIIEKSLAIDQIAVSTYWFLNTEVQPNKNPKLSKQQTNEGAEIYIWFFQVFKEEMRTKNEKVWKIIMQQEKLVKYLRELSKTIKEMPKSERDAEYKRRLMETNWQVLGEVPYPLDIEKVLKCPLPAECFIFKSAMAPFNLTFQLVGGGKFGFIYKNGDDLRQDQLILGFFVLMDKLLKQVNQDYKLTPYQALACSKSDGFVEFVPNTKTFQSVVLKNYLQELIKKHPETAMENYIFSTAGYCAITYFFLIGDRHLQNLLINEQGKMFHIDFGFILGRDPKPYPPPIKISKQMIDAMGIPETQKEQNFKKFKSKCLQAYLYLRKQAKMVYNLTALMLDSGIKDVHQDGLNKLLDKFQINLNDEDAEKHFLFVVEECKNAMFARINDRIHKWRDYFSK